jgi:hypothetical protein
MRVRGAVARLGGLVGLAVRQRRLGFSIQRVGVGACLRYGVFQLFLALGLLSGFSLAGAYVLVGVRYRGGCSLLRGL